MVGNALTPQSSYLAFLLHLFFLLSLLYSKKVKWVCQSSGHVLSTCVCAGHAVWTGRGHGQDLITPLSHFPHCPPLLLEGP